MKSLTNKVVGGLTRNLTADITKSVSAVGASGGSAPNPAFQMLVKTDNAGTSASNQFTFPATAGTYDIDWGDGNSDTGVSGTQTHTYAAAGEYVVKVTGGLTALAFNNGGDKAKLLEIQNWGEIAWSTFSSAFYGCSNMDVTATDAPVLGSVTTMYRMFRGCTSLTTLDVSSWDVSSVTTMYEMFLGCTSLTTLDVSSWNVSSVTSMYRMFLGCTSLTTLDVSSWNVSSVTTMYRMFYNCSSLTTLDVSSWNVSSVTTMNGMFLGVALGTTSYDALLIGWNSLPSLQSSVSFDGGNSQYSAGAAATARANIVSSYSWTITDGGQAA